MGKTALLQTPNKYTRSCFEIGDSERQLGTGFMKVAILMRCWSVFGDFYNTAFKLICFIPRSGSSLGSSIVSYLGLMDQRSPK
eukprot:4250311-Amphidinium_carterae.1